MSKVILQLIWFCIATLHDWLKSRATLSTNQKFITKTNRDCLARVSRMYLLRVMIGSFDFLRLL